MSGQREQILAALQAGRSLTPLDALREFGCLRLGARVYELREQGHAIDVQMVETTSGKRVAQYRLAGEEGQLELFGNRKAPAATGA